MVFHRALAEQKIEGYVLSQSFRLESLPWVSAAGSLAPAGLVVPAGPIYEDWYGLENSCALDAINRAAVAPPAQLPHNLLASEAAFGSAGLYRSRCGPSSFAQTFASWFAKPDGMTYADIDSEMAPALACGATLWQRQLVLGPSPEFCLLSPDVVTLGAPIAVLIVKRDPVS